jgi:hypothetical protein
MSKDFNFIRDELRHGHLRTPVPDDKRVPSDRELRLLYRNRRKQADDEKYVTAISTVFSEDSLMNVQSPIPSVTDKTQQIPNPSKKPHSLVYPSGSRAQRNADAIISAKANISESDSLSLNHEVRPSN